jgi:hypothetical protein
VRVSFMILPIMWANDLRIDVTVGANAEARFNAMHRPAVN